MSPGVHGRGGPRVRTLGHTLCIYHPQIWGPRCAKTQQVQRGVPAQRNVSCPTPRAAVPATPAPCLVSMGPAASPHGHQDLCHNGQSLEGNSDLHRMTAMVKATTWPIAWWAGPRSAEDAAGGRTRPRLQKAFPACPAPAGQLSLQPGPSLLPAHRAFLPRVLRGGNSTLIFHCFYRKVSFCQKGKIKMGTGFPHHHHPSGNRYSLHETLWSGLAGHRPQAWQLLPPPWMREASPAWKAQAPSLLGQRQEKDQSGRS